jgi:hypothetical protein
VKKTEGGINIGEAFNLFPLACQGAVRNNYCEGAVFGPACLIRLTSHIPVRTRIWQSVHEIFPPGLPDRLQPGTTALAWAEIENHSIGESDAQGIVFRVEWGTAAHDCDNTDNPG